MKKLRKFENFKDQNPINKQFESIESKEELIEELSKNQRVYSVEDLEAMDIDQLKDLNFEVATSHDAVDEKKSFESIPKKKSRIDSELQALKYKRKSRNENVSINEESLSDSAANLIGAIGGVGSMLITYLVLVVRKYKKLKAENPQSQEKDLIKQAFGLVINETDKAHR